MNRIPLSVMVVRTGLPFTHVVLRAAIAVVTAVVVAALCWWAVSGGRGLAVAAGELEIVRDVWQSTIDTLVAAWRWVTGIISA